MLGYKPVRLVGVTSNIYINMHILCIVTLMEQALKERERVNFRARTGHKGPEGELRYIYTLSLTLALDGNRWTMPSPSCLSLENRHNTHCTGGWVGHRTGLDGC